MNNKRKDNKKGICVTHKGIIATQSEINYHINLWDAKTGKYIGHLACTERRTKQELKKDIEAMLRLKEITKKMEKKYAENETKTENT